PGLARWCGQHGILVVADEVQTGMGRTGEWFACSHEDVVPDLVVTAKSLGGGLPLGAVTGRADLMDAVHPGGLGGTFGGNPLACAASLAVFEIIASHDLLARARHMEEIVLSRLQKHVSRSGPVGDARGRGAMLAIELVGSDGRTPAPELARAVAASCHRQGVLVLTAGTYGNVIRLLPPLVISDELLDEGLGVLEAALQET
ncbi:MAG TPA: aminotransferase class III-fold pyridoxal phosphate-dependent enzyme, partial [Acidimicrobiales bacterium]|nr:aminotransferase class III-fold pyridoxal phosphate-dependent enzyme [Acidimicrobiales bacterium]